MDVQIPLRLVSGRSPHVRSPQRAGRGQPSGDHGGRSESLFASGPRNVYSARTRLWNLISLSRLIATVRHCRGWAISKRARLGQVLWHSRQSPHLRESPSAPQRQRRGGPAHDNHEARPRAFMPPAAAELRRSRGWLRSPQPQPSQAASSAMSAGVERCAGTLDDKRLRLNHRPNQGPTGHVRIADRTVACSRICPHCGQLLTTLFGSRRSRHTVGRRPATPESSLNIRRHVGIVPTPSVALTAILIGQPH